MPQNVTKIAKEHERLLKENADMHYNLGVLFSQNKQFERASVEFRKVIELRPDDADAHYNLGLIHAEHLPDREKALSHFRRYLALNPRGKDSNWVQQYIASWQAWGAKERLE
jgi:tetratricopeptide (TPR) repeat protein